MNMVTTRSNRKITFIRYGIFLKLHNQKRNAQLNLNADILRNRTHGVCVVRNHSLRTFPDKYEHAVLVQEEPVYWHSTKQCKVVKHINGHLTESALIMLHQLVCTAQQHRQFLLCYAKFFSLGLYPSRYALTQVGHGTKIAIKNICLKAGSVFLKLHT